LGSGHAPQVNAAGDAATRVTPPDGNLASTSNSIPAETTGPEANTTEADFPPATTGNTFEPKPDETANDTGPTSSLRTTTDT
jgi:hypothetical protein